MRHFLSPVAHTLYGIYVITVFCVLGLIALVLLLLPRVPLRTRRALAQRFARAFFQFAGIPVRIEGLEYIPKGPVVVVANHASYLDGVLLKAVLPANFAFVIKKEIVRVPLAGFLLKRIGSEFVDRFNRHAGGLDARRLIKAAASGRSLAFFPEGTITEKRGIARFHPGAFVTAVKARATVVPVAIIGTRNILPLERRLPHPGRIHVRVLEPLPMMSTTATAAVLRDQARAQILAAVGEPDLAGTDPIHTSDSAAAELESLS